jgi:acetyltransferase-like isoleucine patch superfamily enzyme
MSSPTNIFFDLTKLAHLSTTAIVGKTVRIRKPDRVKIGAGSIMDDFTYVSCALVIGSYTHIGANGVIIGGDAQVEIGSFVNIAPGVRLIASSNDFGGGGLVGPTIPPEYVSESITDRIQIDDHVLLGTNVIILPGVHIPEGVSIGAGSLVTKKCKLEPWTLYAGNPLRKLKPRENSKMIAAAALLKKDRPDDFIRH